MASNAVLGYPGPNPFIPKSVALRSDAVDGLVITTYDSGYCVYAQAGAITCYVAFFNTEQEALNYIENDPDDILK